MKVLFSGGGTLGPVTPLLAIKDVIDKAHKGSEFFWIGTKTGPEKDFLGKSSNLKFFAITSGKFRRYFSLFNILDIFKIFIGFFQAFAILWKTNPDLCISAGGFVSVPVHMAAWFLGIPTWIHQQDIKVGLSDKLMAPFAKKITTAVEKNIELFSAKKTLWLGNPVRKEIFEGNKENARKLFHLKKDLPVIFATGGGTGSLRVNQLVVEAAGHLSGVAQIIHLTGKERSQELAQRAEKMLEDYQVHKFFTTEMKEAYAISDIIVSRGGFGTISEISALGKVAVIIPKPGHQVSNVKFLEENHAAVFVNEVTSDGLYLAKVLRSLLEDKDRIKMLSQNLKKLLPPATEDDIISLVEKLVK
ncbi:MAG: hypothetical protein A2493_02915 [Candidatus Magasanikbacteria bacterium RIFOXYC12_FULL_33_11]|uniref:UDP-N-acetylglucosamine--N-acetylmuramyl-(pentapeptide) pyrophosphoryl-undecaprenol N-acetylglucosamine transferase n=1 Tax=Candidatus Magasanikbacteria bacterium RIFOXYC12_FULL_33_11 TaxID=1798701 RepID=A0A1F6NRM8_9BACT|nr:MAG: hypothetical protein A2493_02915 [Candidatus Magasanikbacteria bacterium RIFOXYC12_FULL_33_11]